MASEPLPGEDAQRLDAMTKAEWREVARRLRPDWTDEQFEAAWQEFFLLIAWHAQH